MYLKAVTKSKAPFQSLVFHDFVTHEQRHGHALPEGLAARYARIPDALKNTMRLALDKQLHAFIIREKRVAAALGIATVMRDVSIRNRSGLVIQAHDLDYRLFNGASDAQHYNAAELVVSKSAGLAYKYGNGPIVLSPNRRDLGQEDVVHDYVASISTADPLTNRGFAMLPHMQQADLVYAGPGDDPYGIGKDGAETGMYYGHEIVRHWS
ncbi:MAG: hypothetical protein WAQ57_02750 [Candidatus Saccharimonadales bacterium]